VRLWRWRRKPEPGPSQADEAIEQSLEQLDAIRRQPPRQPHFDALAARLRQVREENHLAEAFRDALERGR
jgi:hypothetical protein